MWNNIRNIFISSKFYAAEIILPMAVMLLVLIFHYDHSLIIISLFLLTFIAILILVGKKRENEISNVKNIINAITNNEYSQADEISLGKNLLGLQNAIRGMFLRSRNDIENLKRLERVRSEFLGNVSHELRTPIFAIQGFIETLLDGALNDPRVNRSFLEKANNHTQNLNNLLNDLIDISMIESGQMRMSFRYFHVNEYLESIIQEMLPLAQEKQLELVYQPVKDKLQAYGDKSRLKQVFVNLIQNAIKYTENGRIELLVTEYEKCLSFSVRDTGLGIENKDLERIFERFYRVDRDRSRAVGGTGLGLAIVKHIIEAHGSKVLVESTPGVGTVFTFNLKK